MKTNIVVLFWKCSEACSGFCHHKDFRKIFVQSAYHFLHLTCLKMFNTVPSGRYVGTDLTKCIRYQSATQYQLIVPCC